MEATLGQWGHSDAIRITDASRLLGLNIGDTCTVVPDVENRTITLDFSKPQKRFKRQVISLEDLCRDYGGDKLSGELIHGSVGAEVTE